MLKKFKKGFTLVELVIVIAVIAILAAVLIPTFSNLVEKANESKALQEAKNIYTEYLVEDASHIIEGKDVLVYTSSKYVVLFKEATEPTIELVESLVEVTDVDDVTGGNQAGCTYKSVNYMLVSDATATNKVYVKFGN